MELLNVPSEHLASWIAWFDTREKATLMVILMTALFLMAWGWVMFRHHRFKTGVTSATKAIRDAIGQSEWTPADRLNAVAKSLDGNHVVSDAWHQYRANLRDDPWKEGA